MVPERVPLSILLTPCAQERVRTGRYIVLWRSVARLTRFERVASTAGGHGVCHQSREKVGCCDPVYSSANWYDVVGDAAPMLVGRAFSMETLKNGTWWVPPGRRTPSAPCSAVVQRLLQREAHSFVIETRMPRSLVASEWAGNIVCRPILGGLHHQCGWI
jgi:hypothetical protein